MNEMKRRKMHPIVQGITWFLIALFVLSGSCLDSESWLPYILTFASMVCLIVIAWVHGVFNYE